MVVAFSVGCASFAPKTTSTESSSAPTTKDSVEAEATPLKDIDSFRLSDAEKNRVVDEELEGIPTEVNPMVEKWIAYFQGRGRPHMERYLSRSTRYEKLMKKVLSDNGLPDDLFYIALIESGFSSRATSHAAAVGYWQFIRGTGKRYGLEINKFIDERRDPVLATQAAAEYFKGLYSLFGSWYLAMASYNVGENKVKKVVMKHMTRDFWELTRKKGLPKETVNYIPKFIAAKLIAKNPEKYGFEGIDYMPPIEFDHVDLKEPVNLRVMAEKMNLNYEDFKDLNPKFKGEVAPVSGSHISIRIPPGTAPQALLAASESKVEKVEYVADSGDTQIYKIRSGDSLYTIARKYRTTVAFLRDLNDLPKGKKLRIGMRLQVPDRTPLKDRKSKTASSTGVKSSKKISEIESRKVASATTKSSSGSTAGASKLKKYHLVQSGDSLFSIAQRYNISISELKKVNRISSGKILRTGVKLKIPGAISENSNEDFESNKKKTRRI